MPTNYLSTQQVVIKVSLYWSFLHCSASLATGVLEGFELLLSDEVKLGLHGQKILLVGSLVLIILLEFGFVTLLALCLFLGLLDLFLFDLLVPLFAHGNSTRLDVVALNNFVVPEVPDLLFLVLLRLSEIRSDFLQV